MSKTARRHAPAALITAMLTLALSVLIAPAGSASPAAGNDSREFAPINRPGPALSVSAPTLAKSLNCTANTQNSKHNVVLLVHGTTSNPGESFEWNWFRALDRLDRPYCAVTLPNRAMSDAQVSAEYVVHAVRHIHETSGRQVDVLGHSQGGLVPRFAMRFWPDIRPMVDDYVSFGATNHGSFLVNALCPPVLGCAPSLWQQTSDSNFTKATNSGQETFAGISYTNVYTHTDEFVRPALDDTGTSSLHSGDGRITNVAIQDVCPLGLTSEHIAVGTYDPVAYALAMDALDHDGPTRPSRVPRSVCTQPFMPGVEATRFPTEYVNAMSGIASELVLQQRTDKEPELKPYVFAN
ncbi:alpha/beta hydrolase family protein [Tamaricihabitans halophyticus]|uniref:Alpha/beta hydrolase family protein n=1 Tax=Tamaricihabitans halophyticus TaxID=1262583 RepID=A0A4R2PY90_9PSEU|nr:alpha/beta fold hydrolase [Tamaricihabitans halophyticus]TCP41222.1 alpha/beta hydrolase family protein [Tamaricihabitans halophyticus]